MRAVTDSDPGGSWASAVYTGEVRHRRRETVSHEFRYRVGMLFLDLSEIPSLFGQLRFGSDRRPALIRFRRGDYLGPEGQSLDEAVRDRVDSLSGRRPTGPIRLLTHVRMLGHLFNPVSFYYCYDREGRRVESVLSEITNTPWNERHAYVVPGEKEAPGIEARTFRFRKAFHVSPFLGMQYEYRWRFGEPGRRLTVHMENRRLGSEDDAGRGAASGSSDVAFDATLSLERHEWTPGHVRRAVVRSTVGTVGVLGAIYWQAMRLWMKRAPFHTHPAKTGRS